MAEKSFAEDLENSEPVEAPVVEAEAPAEAKQPRDEHGKFAKKGEEESEGAPPASPQEFDGAATIAERRKRQEAEAREREALDRIARLEQQFQQQQNPPPPPFDPETVFTDPAGFTNHLTSQFQQALYQERYANSLWRAEQAHGKETVAEAVNWAAQRAQQDPQFNMAALQQMDPVGFAVEHHRREQFASINPEDFAAFQQWQAQQGQQAQQPPPAQPPPTLTGERNLGKREGPVTTGPATFGEILNT